MPPTPKWRLLSVSEKQVQQLNESLRIAPLLSALLVQRGINNFAAAEQFFRLDLSQLHSPLQMADMERAVDRLYHAVQKQEQVLLYGDYDVDGTTSVALLYAFLSPVHSKLDYYLPDRDKEGYGLSMAGVEYAGKQGATVLVVMDCGIKAHAAIENATTMGIDVIVCDHHLPGLELPSAYAVLDPKRTDCSYPFKDLSGCGIVFKLVQALAEKLKLPNRSWQSLLDLVALSVACDLVPMSGENRMLTRFGIQEINRKPRLGIHALIRASGRKAPLAVGDLVFGLGPLINAAGRLGDARLAVQLLLSQDRQYAFDLATQLSARNRERRRLDQSITDEAKQLLNSQPALLNRKTIVVHNPNWHKGVIGIVASRLVEHYHKPAVVLTNSKGRAVGSARSVAGFDLYAALDQCRHLFSSFGGHAFAAGLQLHPDQIPEFAEAFEQAVQASISPAAEQPELLIDGMLDFADITPAFWKILRQFAPFGPGNMVPVFWAKQVRDAGRSKLLDNNHVRLELRQEQGPVFTGIGFGLGETFAGLRDRPFDLAYSLYEDNWRGESKLSIMAKAMR